MNSQISLSELQTPNSLENAQKLVSNAYGNKVRLRVCGLWTQNQKVLVIRHRGVGPKGYLWAPPGGGVQFGEPVKTALIREVFEECRSKVEIGSFLFAHEYIGQSIHTVELFFEIFPGTSNPSLGIDPEMEQNAQIMDAIKFVSFEEALSEGLEYYHDLFKAGSISNLLKFKWV